MNSKQLDGLPVIGIAEGAKLGAIGETWIDPEAMQIATFAISDGSGLFSVEREAVGWIESADVQAIGPDALMVSDDSKLQAEAPVGEWLAIGDLIKRVVVTEGGKDLGTVNSIEFDSNGLGLQEIEISTGLFSSNLHVPADQIINVGGEMVIVSDAAERQGREPEQEEMSDGERPMVVGDVDKLPHESTEHP